MKYIKEINDYFLNSLEKSSILTKIINKESDVSVKSFELFLNEKHAMVLNEKLSKGRKTYIDNYKRKQKQYNGKFHPAAKDGKFIYRYRSCFV